jgi:hypothetical protein
MLSNINSELHLQLHTARHAELVCEAAAARRSADDRARHRDASRPWRLRLRRCLRLRTRVAS